uniref:Uncharacterized protein n=1 Tax=Fagus sylvatica TaxID=28930 RepID=A0A2N9GEJ3_FAGSY
MISLFDTCPSFTGHVLRSDGSFRMPEVFNYLNPRKQFLLLFSYFIFPFFLALCSAAFVLVLLALLSFSGVCRTAESEGRPISFGDLIPSGCVLHRLSEELFELVFPALNTWREVRALMVSEGGSWTSVRSEDLPEGLSDRDEGTRSLEETPSISGSSEGENIRFRRTSSFGFLSRTKLHVRPRYGDVAFYEADFNARREVSLTAPDEGVAWTILTSSPGQLAPKCLEDGRSGVWFMWKVLSEGKDDLTLDELACFVTSRARYPPLPGFWSLNMRQEGFEVGSGAHHRPTGKWKDNLCLSSVETIGRVSCVRRTTISSRVRRKWGVPFVLWSLKRPTLSSDGHNRVLRALHHNQHHYKHFVRPELLAQYSFGPEPSEDVLSLQEINQKRMATAKLNREKLRKMMASQQDEAPLTIGKKRKTELSLFPPRRIEVMSRFPAEPSSSRSVEKGADVYLGMPPWPVGLTELTVIANRCTQVGGGTVEAEGSDVGSRSSQSKVSERRCWNPNLQLLKSLLSRTSNRPKRLTTTIPNIFCPASSFLKKQAKEKYPELDFEAFQPFDDDESVMPGDDGNVGPSSQMDDDATS